MEYYYTLICLAEGHIYSEILYTVKQSDTQNDVYICTTWRYFFFQKFFYLNVRLQHRMFQSVLFVNYVKNNTPVDIKVPPLTLILIKYFNKIICGIFDKILRIYLALCILLIT